MFKELNTEDAFFDKSAAIEIAKAINPMCGLFLEGQSHDDYIRHENVYEGW